MSTKREHPAIGNLVRPDLPLAAGVLEYFSTSRASLAVLNPVASWEACFEAGLHDDFDDGE
jgi:hypothetical protein